MSNFKLDRALDSHKLENAVVMATVIDVIIGEVQKGTFCSTDLIEIGAEKRISQLEHRTACQSRIVSWQPLPEAYSALAPLQRKGKPNPSQPSSGSTIMSLPTHQTEKGGVPRMVTPNTARHHHFRRYKNTPAYPSAAGEKAIENAERRRRGALFHHSRKPRQATSKLVIKNRELWVVCAEGTRFDHHLAAQTLSPWSESLSVPRCS